MENQITVAELNHPKAQTDVFEALTTRRSVRGFLTDKPVPRETVEQILNLAARAPSGTNIQPWKIHVTTGGARDRLVKRLMDDFQQGAPNFNDDFQYYPAEWTEPYITRRRKLGKDLYTLAGVPKGDKEAMAKQMGKNYTFFGAPVGLILTMDRAMGTGGWVDVGTFLMGILIAARGFGLHTCPQQAFSGYHKLIREELNIPESEIVVCGVALGYEDTSVPENALQTEREPVANFAQFHEA